MLTKRIIAIGSIAGAIAAVGTAWGMIDQFRPWPTRAEFTEVSNTVKDLQIKSLEDKKLQIEILLATEKRPTAREFLQRQLLEVERKLRELGK